MLVLSKLWVLCKLWGLCKMGFFSVSCGFNIEMWFFLCEMCIFLLEFVKVEGIIVASMLGYCHFVN